MITLDDVALMVVDVRRSPRPAIDVLHELLVGGLSPQQRIVFDLVRQGKQTSEEICEGLGLEINQVGNILLRLYELLLLERTGTRREYSYKEASLWETGTTRPST